jgi:hypothetical protein
MAIHKIDDKGVDHPIASIDDWFVRAAPKGKEKHWQAGRSAMEAARAWLEGGGVEFPTEVHAALAGHADFGPVLSWDAEPEARLKFDSFAGETRNCDLAVVARDSVGPYLLAVEAKADESFGETVSAALAAAVDRRIKNARSNGIARIEALACMLLRPRAEKLAKAGELRYQLLTACAGALAEADRLRVSRAVMLVHEFVTPGGPDKESATSDTKLKRNGADLARFVGRVAGQPLESVPDGRLHGPFEFKGAAGVKLYIGKVRRTLKPAK